MTNKEAIELGQQILEQHTELNNLESLNKDAILRYVKMANKSLEDKCKMNELIKSNLLVDCESCRLHTQDEINKILVQSQIPQWISVEDKLPKKSGEYLVTIKDIEDASFLLLYSNLDQTWFDVIDEEIVKFEVIAWMEKPKPYKESEVEHE